MKADKQPLTAVSQFMTRSHGQGKINLELLTRLLDRGRRVEAVASWLEEDVAKHPHMTWQRINVPHRVPTNWLRCETFRRRAQFLLRNKERIEINNGAAVVAPSIVNIAMFVHSAWLASPWHPRHTGTMRGRFQAAFNAHQSQLEKRAFGKARWVVALSDEVRREIIEHCGIQPEHVVTIPPGVDAEQFQPLGSGAPNALRTACGLADRDDRSLAIFVGEIRSSRKNLDLVLNALVNQPELVLAVVGSDVGSPYPAMTKRLGIADRVFFLGQRNDVATLMPGADFFVFPTHYEPFGIVITEAMACGLPVITTRQAGGACVIEHGQQGWLLEDGSDSEGLDAALTELTDPQRRSEWGASARTRAESLTWEKMADRYEELLATHD